MKVLWTIASLITITVLLLEVQALRLPKLEIKPKVPEGKANTVYVTKNGTAEITFELCSPEPAFKKPDVHVQAYFNGNRIDTTFKSNNTPYTVVYNSGIIHSATPRMTCKQVEISLYGAEFDFNTISFYLYRGIMRKYLNSTLQLVEGPAVTANNHGSSQRQDPVFPDYAAIVVIALASVFLVAFIITLVALIITCKWKGSKRNEGSTEDVELGQDK